MNKSFNLGSREPYESVMEGDQAWVPGRTHLDKNTLYKMSPSPLLRVALHWVSIHDQLLLIP